MMNLVLTLFSALCPHNFKWECQIRSWIHSTRAWGEAGLESHLRGDHVSTGAAESGCRRLAERDEAG